MFVFTACRERNELLRGGEEGKTLAFLREQMRDEAVKQEALWRDKKVTVGRQNAFKEGSPDNPPCHCSYVVESVQVQTPVDHPDFGIEFWSPDGCSSNPWDCNYFSGLYYTLPCYAPIDPACLDEWQDLPPVGAIPFDCDVPAFGTFTASAAAVWLTENCFGDYTPYGITVRIICSDSAPNSCAGSPATYVSPPFTLKHTGGTASASVELIDCGCKPRITLIN